MVMAAAIPERREPATREADAALTAPEPMENTAGHKGGNIKGKINNKIRDSSNDGMSHLWQTCCPARSGEAGHLETAPHVSRGRQIACNLI